MTKTNLDRLISNLDIKCDQIENRTRPLKIGDVRALINISRKLIAEYHKMTGHKSEQDTERGK